MGRLHSHTYNLHNLASNGKTMIPMVSGPILVNGRLETESQYKERLKRDFILSSTLIKKHVGKAPIAIAYPFGAGNHISNEIARKAGFEMAFAQEREGVVRCGDDVMSLKRIIINNSFTGRDIINQINKYGR
ncbi:MAG: polysaccharide deacetylase family protein [Thermoanaerobacteraceae bacterium]|nr:polysaccharide deacetylase family protein [Thermoanaerobacteraceae bacterium]